MDVAVDEPRHHRGVAELDDARVRRRARRHGFDPLAAHDDVCLGDVAAADVEQAPRVQCNGLRRRGQRARGDGDREQEYGDFL